VNTTPSGLAKPPPHATLLKFGYPGSLLEEGRHWAVLARPAQPTLGSLVLCSTSPALSYADLGDEAFAEQGHFVRKIRTFLEKFCNPERINYLMLMMVDPHVHFHVIPRYSGERTFGAAVFPDSGWPGIPNLAEAVPATAELIENMRDQWKA
jgi:diadenosine tetraphosphate (Ap4A) HIT family hydrolase